MSYFDSRHHGRKGKYSPAVSILEAGMAVNHMFAFIIISSSSMTAIIINIANIFAVIIVISFYVTGVLGFISDPFILTSGLLIFLIFMLEAFTSVCYIWTGLNADFQWVFRIEQILSISLYH